MPVQGHPLDVTVVGCSKLKDTEWFSRQDPYVILEYGTIRHRTKIHTDGGRNPTFNDQYMLPLIEDLREINVEVWNSNMIRKDYFIGSGKILLQKALTEGYHDGTWPLTTRNGRRAGEIKVTLRYTNHAHYTPPAYGAAPAQPSGYGGYPPVYAPYPPSPYATAHAPPQVPQYGGGYPPPTNPPQGYPPTNPPQGCPPAYPPQGTPYPPPVATPYPPY